MAGRLLVAYSNASNYVSTTAEYLDSIARYSQWDVSYVHVTAGAELDFDLDEFDAVIQSYCARLPVDGHVSPDYISQLRSFRGVKMLAVQDEYERTDKLKDAIRAIGYHVVLTCVPPGMVQSIYPRELFPEIEFITVLTGYVPEQLAERGKTPMPLHDRSIHIGYRGNELGAHYGRLGFYKFEIGRRMREICAAREIPHDIEWTADKRLYGDAWYNFIGSCRANLGSESGSNVFDFDGTIEATYRNLVAARRGAPVPYEEFRSYTDPIEGRYAMGQISPRVFEAAAMRTPMILLSGRYSGLIRPDEHYIELKEDFSNVDAVLARLDDVEGLSRMADRAYERLVVSGDFSYRRFVKLIDDKLSRKTRELGLALRAPRDFGTLEVGTDPVALASLREQPTKTPRHFVFFQYKYMAHQHALMVDEVARLHQYYPEQIARLSREITLLVKAIDEYTIRTYLRAKYLRWVHPIADKAAMRALCLKVLLGDRAGRAALAEVAITRSLNRALLVQLARVIAARTAPVTLAGRFQMTVLLPRLSNGLLELLVLSDTHSMQSITQTISSSDLVTALAARRVHACELVFDPGVRRRSRLIIHSRHGLPDLLRWLNDRPERVMALWLDSRHSLGQSVNQTRMPAPAALASTPEAS